MAKNRDNKKHEQKKRRQRVRREKAKTKAADDLVQLGKDLLPGATIVHGIPGMPKMSEQLLALVDPYLEAAETPEAYRKLLTVGATAWNAALKPAAERPAFLESFLKHFGGKNSPNAKIFLEIVTALIQRKESDPRLAQDSRLIVDFVVSDTPTGGNLQVLSVVPPPK